MPQIDITLPSGARGRIRGLKGREVNLFANRENARRNKTALEILNNVWLETHDSGPLYKDKINWSEAPLCDRFVALFKARIASFGADYTFKHQCSGCGKRYEWTEDLEKREVRPMPAESIETFAAGNRFRTSVRDSEGNVRAVTFQLLTPKLEEKINTAQAVAPREKATVGLAQRIVAVQGVEDGKAAIKQFIEDIDAGAMFDLVDAMDEVDGGIDTTITVECPHCGWEEEMELPLEEEFWKPARPKRSTPSTEM